MPFQPYGLLGIGTGKMPGFANQLLPDQIGEIVAYERYCLEPTDYLGVSPPCETKPKPRVPPTSTTTTTAAK